MENVGEELPLIAQRPLGPLISSSVRQLSRCFRGGVEFSTEGQGCCPEAGSPGPWGEVPRLGSSGLEPLMGVQQFPGGMGRTCAC